MSNQQKPSSDDLIKLITLAIIQQYHNGKEVEWTKATTNILVQEAIKEYHNKLVQETNNKKSVKQYNSGSTEGLRHHHKDFKSTITTMGLKESIKFYPDLMYKVYQLLNKYNKCKQILPQYIQIQLADNSPKGLGYLFIELEGLLGSYERYNKGNENFPINNNNNNNNMPINTQSIQQQQQQQQQLLPSFNPSSIIINDKPITTYYWFFDSPPNLPSSQIPKAAESFLYKNVGNSEGTIIRCKTNTPNEINENQLGLTFRKNGVFYHRVIQIIWLYNPSNNIMEPKFGVHSLFELTKNIKNNGPICMYNSIEELIKYMGFPSLIPHNNKPNIHNMNNSNNYNNGYDTSNNNSVNVGNGDDNLRVNNITTLNDHSAKKVKNNNNKNNSNTHNINVLQNNNLHYEHNSDNSVKINNSTNLNHTSMNNITTVHYNNNLHYQCNNNNGINIHNTNSIHYNNSINNTCKNNATHTDNTNSNNIIHNNNYNNNTNNYCNNPIASVPSQHFSVATEIRVNINKAISLVGSDKTTICSPIFETTKSQSLNNNNIFIHDQEMNTSYNNSNSMISSNDNTNTSNNNNRNAIRFNDDYLTQNLDNNGGPNLFEEPGSLHNIDCSSQVSDPPDLMDFVNGGLGSFMDFTAFYNNNNNIHQFHHQIPDSNTDDDIEFETISSNVS